MKVKSIRTGFLAIILPLVVATLLILTLFSYSTARGLLETSLKSEME